MSIDRAALENGVIGRLISQHREVGLAMEQGLVAEHFSRAHARDVMTAVMGGAVSASDVLKVLRDDGKFEPNHESLVRFAVEAPWKGSLPQAVGLLKQEAAFDSILQLTSTAHDFASNRRATPIEIARQMADSAQALVASGASDKSEDIDAALEEVVSAAEHGKTHGIKTGFPWLDFATGGFRPGQVWIVAASSSVGKSTMAMTMLDYLIDTEHRVALWSLEMPATEVMQRFMSKRAEIDLRRLVSGVRLKRDEMQRLVAAQGMFPSDLIRIFCTGDTSAASVEAEVIRLSKRGVRVIVLDQLELMRHPKGDRHDLRMRATTTRLKQVAMRYGITVVIVHQLNRSTLKERQQPTMHDLRDSAIENDADVVLLLHRAQAMPNEGAPVDPKEPILTKCIVGKNRNGPRSFFMAELVGQYAHFRPLDFDEVRERDGRVVRQAAAQ